MSKLNKILLVVWGVSVAVLTFLIVQSTFFQKEETQVEKVRVEVEEKIEEKPVPPPKPEKKTVTVAMVGDVLLHLRLALYSDYISSFAAVKSYLEQPDFTLANMESPPVGNKFKLSGYPQFSSPPHIIRDLQASGVDMLNIANNHTIDKGELGVKTYFENLDTYQMPYVGAYKSQEDANTKRIVELDGIKIGFVSYTYGTNGLFLPKNSPYIINYIDGEKMKADVAALKDSVDIVIAIMHWGVEYVTQENDYQRQYANLLNEAGVDVIFGMHPHILQPYTVLTNANGEQTHVFYSLGNFYSTTLNNMNTMIGGVGTIDVTKEGESVTVGAPHFYSTAVLKDADGVYRMYPLKDVENRAPKGLNWVKGILGENVTVQ